MNKNTFFSNEKLMKVQDLPKFSNDLWKLLSKFAGTDPLKLRVKHIIWEELPLIKAVSPTWVTYCFCNEVYDSDLDGVYLSEIVADIEDLIVEIEILIEKYQKSIE